MDPQRRGQERNFSIVLFVMYPGKQRPGMTMKDGEITVRNMKPFIGL
jgi:hypothetical protein